MFTARLIYRAVRGAVRNAASAHPHWDIRPSMAGSIAKRATGTILALYRRPEGLAAPAPSERVAHLRLGRRERVASVAPGRRHSLLNEIHRTFGAMAGEARRAGNFERERAFVEVLRWAAEKRAKNEIAA